MIKFNAQLVTLDAAAEDGTPTRTITGLAVPWNVVANLSGDVGPVKFLEGSISVDGPMPKLLEYHDDTRIIGRVTERVSTEDGLMFVAKVSTTRAGDDAMALLADGSISAVSVGAMPIKFKRVDGVMEVSEARLMEISLVSFPAYTDAEIQSVYASAEEPQEIPEEPTPPQPSEEDDMSEPTIVEAALATQPIYATAKREFVLPSAGEFMAAYHIGGDTFANMNAAVAEYSNGKRTALQAAAGDVLTSDTPGLLPVPVLGPLVQDLNFLRPCVEAVGARAYPDNGQSKTFVRPTITTHTSVATQSTELSAVSATTMVIAANTISKTTLAGQVTLSEQDISFTSPQAMQLILNDLMGEAMIASDNLCADNLLAAATSSGVWDLTVADLLKSVYDSAVDISSNRNWTPTHMFVSPDVWGQLGQLADTTGRPVFPFIGAGLTGQNALGNATAASWNGNPLGLQLVVDSNFASKTMVITRVGQGQGDAYEYYEQIKGLMSFENPSVLGRTMSYHLYASTFAAVPGMIRKITQA